MYLYAIDLPQLLGYVADVEGWAIGHVGIIVTATAPAAAAIALAGRPARLLLGGEDGSRTRLDGFAGRFSLYESMS